MLTRFEERIESLTSKATTAKRQSINKYNMDDVKLLIQTMRSQMRKDEELIEELDRNLVNALAQRDEALEMINSLTEELEQWKRIALDYSCE
jgi:hypothetical protein